MKAINISKTLAAKRREKGITQEDLAAYMGVSKAAVSKWETGLSYPDITFLPLLAAYFNISIDELMGYSPQMPKTDINKLYFRLSNDFTLKAFDLVLKECNAITKKYYACFPLLLHMALLLINHHMLAEDKEHAYAILDEAIKLCCRIKEESNDVLLSKDAALLEANCYLIKQEPEKVFALYPEQNDPFSQESDLAAMAYQMIGDFKKANETVQANLYHHLISILSSSTQLLTINSDDDKKVKEILDRAIGLAELFEIDKLNPNITLILYLNAAQIYCSKGDTDKALGLLKRYCDVGSTWLFPVTLHGDKFFDAIETVFEDYCLLKTPPRSEQLIEDSLIQGIECNEGFALLKDHPEFKRLIKRLKLKLGNRK